MTTTDDSALPFGSFFESAPGCHLILDHALTIVAVSDDYARATMVRREEIVGNYVFEAFPDNPDVPDANGVRNLRASLERVLEGRVPDRMPIQRYDVRRPKAQGGGFEERYWEPVNTPVPGPDGEVAYIVHTVTDVTSRERAEATLRRTEARRSYLLSLGEGLHELTDPIQMMDVATELLGRHLAVAQVGFGEIDDGQERATVHRDWNDGRIPSVVGTWRMDDFGPAFIADMKAGETVVIPDVAGDPRTRAASVLDAYRAIGTRAILDVPLVRDGRLVAILFIHHPEPREWTEEEVIAVEETCRRLWSAVERARAEERLRHSESLYRALAANLPSGAAFLVDRDFRYRLAEGQALGSVGLISEQLEGKLIREVLPDHIADLHEANYRKVFGGETFEAEHAANGRYFATHGVPLRADDGTIYAALAVSYDITDRKRLEEALKENDRKKDEFLAMLAHELRNPLAAVANAVQLSKRSSLAEHQEWARQVVEVQVRNFSRLIDDLLDVSRITRGKIELRKQVVDVRPVVESAVAAVTPLVDQRHHRLTVEYGHGDARVEADPTRLEQVVANLLTNAAKYSEDGGRVQLRTGVEAGELVITIEDMGIGIPPEKIPQMFELFAQGDRSIARSEGGLGIGLTLARRLLEMHGGAITATSEGPGRGSTFTVRLPTTEAAPTDVDADRGERPGGAEKLRVLVVDDNVDTARGMARLLKVDGHDVALAHDGPSALEVAKTFGPDAVVLDIGLPGMDGYEVAGRLRHQSCCAHACLIAVTGYGQERDRTRAREAGFDHHLTKPVDYGSLARLLSRTCRSSENVRHAANA